MSYRSLARTWRPQTFAEVIGQEPIVRTLTHAVEAGRIAQAYLFSGQRGVGKTSLARILAKTLTYDQGKEMSEHRTFTMATGIQVYFAHPGSPWERGTNESTNGLLRQYFPKGTDFSTLSVRAIKRVERELNDRPRAVLDYLKPDEVFTKLVALKS